MPEKLVIQWNTPTISLVRWMECDEADFRRVPDEGWKHLPPCSTPDDQPILDHDDDKDVTNG